MFKTGAAFLLLLLLLTGCGDSNPEMDTAVKLRSNLLQATQCTFDATVTADYADMTYRFQLQCCTDSDGTVSFRISQPDSIAGIEGTISGTDGELIFSDTALHFDLMADGKLSPVSAPWIFINTLRSGYVTSACSENNQIHLTINDSFEDESLQLDIWLENQTVPKCADILFDGQRILSMEVSSFQIL